MKKTQCTFKEIITPEIFYALKVVFAKCEQTQKAFEEVTVRRARTNGKQFVHKSGHVQNLKILADKRQAGVGA